MKALTLLRPWPWVILHSGKRVENRTWRPPPFLIGRRFAIHEGKRWDESGARWIEETIGTQLPAALQHAPGGVIVATAELVGFDCASLIEPDDVWAAPGQYHWRLDDVRPMREDVPCRGAQGLWDIPPRVLDRVFDEERHT